MKKIILASASPRRKEALEKLELDFEIIPSLYEEVLDSYDFSYEKIEELAFNKAKEVYERIGQDVDALIVSADTVVVLDNQILIKPKSFDDAVCMLKSLSANSHSVVTSICVIDSKSGNEKLCSTTSYVEFNALSEEQIRHYVENFKPFDKAGSYGIQELPDGFVANVSGSFENIVGLCSEALLSILN